MRRPSSECWPFGQHRIGGSGRERRVLGSAAPLARGTEANHLEFLERADALDDPAASLHLPRGWTQHQQERLAAAAGQPVARIARLWWPDPREYLRDPEGFRRMLRPACRRCAARRGIAEPIACHLPPHLTICRRHRLWIGPSARDHAGQLDVSSFPEIFRAQRRHLSLVRHHRWRQVDDAISEATDTIWRVLRAGAWTGRRLQRFRQLDRTWPQDAASAPAGDTTALATPPSRSPSTPTSSRSPRSISGHATPSAMRSLRLRVLQPNMVARASERVAGRREAAATKECRPT